MVTRSDILECWIVEPTLTFAGFCTNPVKLHSGRAALIESLAEVQLCHDWIMSQEIGDKVTRWSPNSYTLKHYVEFCARQMRIHPDYVSNGCFIAAAIIAGVPYKRVESKKVRFVDNRLHVNVEVSPNALVAIKHKPIRGKRYPVGPYINGKQYAPLQVLHRSEA